MHKYTSSGVSFCTKLNWFRGRASVCIRVCFINLEMILCPELGIERNGSRAQQQPYNIREYLKRTHEETLAHAQAQAHSHTQRRRLSNTHERGRWGVYATLWTRRMNASEWVAKCDDVHRSTSNSDRCRSENRKRESPETKRERERKEGESAAHVQNKHFRRQQKPK